LIFYDDENPIHPEYSTQIAKLSAGSSEQSQHKNFREITNILTFGVIKRRKTKKTDFFCLFLKKNNLLFGAFADSSYFCIAFRQKGA